MVGDREKLFVGPEHGHVVAVTHIQIILAEINLVLLATLVIDEPAGKHVVYGGTDPGTAVAPDGKPAAAHDRDCGLEAFDDATVKHIKIDRRKLLSLGPR